MEVLQTTLGEFAVGRFIGEHFRQRMCQQDGIHSRATLLDDPRVYFPPAASIFWI